MRLGLGSRHPGIGGMTLTLEADSPHTARSRHRVAHENQQYIPATIRWLTTTLKTTD